MATPERASLTMRFVYDHYTNPLDVLQLNNLPSLTNRQIHETYELCRGLLLRFLGVVGLQAYHSLFSATVSYRHRVSSIRKSSHDVASFFFYFISFMTIAFDNSLTHLGYFNCQCLIGFVYDGPSPEGAAPQIPWLPHSSS